MAEVSPVTELVLRYQELRSKGQPVTPESICASRPDLIAEVKRQIQILDQLETKNSVTHIESVHPYAVSQRNQPFPEIPDHEILEVLGQGGMGIVYKAMHRKLKRLVAVKMILTGERTSATSLARFRAEGEAVAKIQHPNIVQIYELGEVEGKPYFTLEYVDGGSLDKRIRNGPLPPRQSAHIMLTLAAAMHAAHEKGVVHRDLKPANVLLTSGKVTFKITDFGLAKQLDEQQGMTVSGAVMGTPSYMAPEQAEGRANAINPRTDVYALGAILYELLTGRPPFLGASVIDTLQQVTTQEPVPLRQLTPTIPLDLETICLKCLRKDSSKRYSSAADLGGDVQRFLSGIPIQARRVNRAERLWRWTRRHPTVATLLILLILVTTIGLTMVTAKWIEASANARKADNNAHNWRLAAGRADQEASVARTAQKEAETQAALAWRSEYASEMTAIQQLWEAGYPTSHVRERLERLKPGLNRQDIRGFEWFYYDKQCQPLGWAVGSPNDRISCVGFSWDESAVAIGFESGDVRMKLLAGNDWLSFSQESDQPVLAISFSPSGRSLLAVFPNMIVSWDVDSRRRQSARLLSTKAAHFSPRGNLLISFASVEGRIWNISEHGQIDAGWSLTQEVSLGPVSLSQFGTSVAGRVSSKAEAGIWDIVSGTRTTTVRSRMHWGFEKVVIHPNGRALLTGYRDGVLEGWEIPTGKSLGKLNGHKVPVVAIAYSADGKVVVSGGRSQSGRGSEVIVWDGQRDKEKRRIRANKSISDLVLSSGGTWLALLETDGIATIMKTDGHANEILPFEKETNWFNEVNCLAFSPDSRFVVGGNGPPSSFVASGFLYVWDVQNARFVARHQKLNNSNVCAVAFVGDNELVFGGIQAYLNGFDLGTGGTTLRYFKSTDIFSVTLAIAMSPDRKMFAVGTGSVRAIPKSLDGPLSEIKLFEVGNVNPVGFFKDENLGVHALAISQDGNLLASGGQDGSLVVWDIAARKKRQSLLGNDQTVSCVAFSKDGRYLACGRHDHNVRVWNLSTGDQVGLFRGHGGYVTSIVFDPSGESIVSASADRTVRIWDFVTGQARASWAVAESAKSSPRYDTGFVRKGAFDTVPMALSPDGNTLVVGVSGEGIRMWRASPR